MRALASIPCSMSHLVLIVAALMMPALAAATPERVFINDYNSVNELGSSLQILEDPQGNKRVSNFLKNENEDDWFNSEETVPNFGYSQSIFWFRTSLVNKHSQRTEWLLNVDYPLIDYLDVYIVRNKEIIQAYHVGDKLPHEHRPIDHRNFLFPLALPPTVPTEIYIRLETQGSVKMPLYLWEEAEFIKSDQSFMLGQGVFIGGMLIMFFYNLFRYAP